MFWLLNNKQKGNKSFIFVLFVIFLLSLPNLLAKNSEDNELGELDIKAVMNLMRDSGFEDKVVYYSMQNTLENDKFMLIEDYKFLTLLNKKLTKKEKDLLLDVKRRARPIEKGTSDYLPSHTLLIHLRNLYDKWLGNELERLKKSGLVNKENLDLFNSYKEVADKFREREKKYLKMKLEYQKLAQRFFDFWEKKQEDLKKSIKKSEEELERGKEKFRKFVEEQKKEKLEKTKIR